MPSLMSRLNVMVGRMTKPQVRPAIVEDADAIAAAHHSAWVQTYSGGKSTALSSRTPMPAPDSPTELWVAEADPRARRFYEKHGFVSDGARFTDDLEIAEIRMVRGAR
jgi:hypothetical protein